MTEFTPLASFAGGVLIGISVVFLMATGGWLAGVSGIVSGLLPPLRPGVAVRVAFVGGLVMAPLVYGLAGQGPVEQVVPDNVVLVVAAGLLVGFGAVIGNGCTSGHGVCGLSRFSVRSLAATATFMATGVVTVAFLRHLGGG